VSGTPAYMAPEQLEGKTLTPATDVYALGVVLYEMVTRARPFEGGSAFSVAAQRLTRDPVPPSRHAPGLDPLWESVILRCLARDPSSRYARATQVLEDLQRGSREATRTFRSTAPVAPGPATAPRPASAPGRGSAYALAALVATLCYGAVLFAVRTGFFFFVPTGRYLASAGWPQLAPLVLLAVAPVRRGLFQVFVWADGRLRRAGLGGALLLAAAAAASGLALKPGVDLQREEQSVDAEDQGGLRFDEVTAPSVRGDTLCHAADERRDPDRQCDAAVPDSGHLRLRVRLGWNQVVAPRMFLEAGPAGATAFARVRLDRRLGFGSAGIRNVGSTLELAGTSGQPLAGSFELRVVLRQLPGEAAVPQLRLTLTGDTEGTHAQRRLERCWTVAEGGTVGPCRDPAARGGR